MGIAPAGPIARSAYVRAWLDGGHAGEMAYLHRRAELREDPRQLLEGAQSIIVVADLYRQAEPEPPPNDEPVPRGRIARYAWGRDYHKILRKKLHRLTDALHEAIDEPFDARVCVDTAPLIEREAAAAAGVGWIGKNTMVIDPALGSFFFLGEIITTLELAPSPPMTDHCGSCTRCLDACPTDALTAPYRMDATRCISYLTIEHRSEIPAPLQPLMDDWVFGCDVCQDVCPYNRQPSVAADPAYQPRDRKGLGPRPPLAELLDLDDQAYRARLAGSAVKRATPLMLQRNARIVRANLARARTSP